MAEHDYRPGDDVPLSGIYRVLHQTHREAHEAVVLKGTAFPGCKGCGDNVRYRLLRSASPLDHDSDFIAGNAPEKAP
jgi:hypothetical protein